MISEEAKKRYQEWENSSDDDDSNDNDDNNNYGWFSDNVFNENPYSYIEGKGVVGKLRYQLREDGNHLFGSSITHYPGELRYEVLTFEEAKTLAKKYADEKKYTEAGILYILLSQMNENCVVIIEGD